MNVTLITIMMFASMMALLTTGRQIFLIVGAVATVSCLALWGTGGVMMPHFNAVNMIYWDVMLSFPAFIFMGYMLARSGMADALYDMIYKWMGGVRGGLGMGSIGICALIGAVQGTCVSGQVAMGLIALPSMLKRKYSKSIVTGLIQAGGGLGYLIPPSLVFVLYGYLAKVPIGHLWLAGAIPGLILAGMYIAYIGIRCQLQPHIGPPIPLEERASWREKFISMRAGVAPLVLLFVVMGLLIVGVTTVTESSAIGAIGSIVVAVVYRRFNWADFVMVVDHTWRLTSIIMWIFVAAILFGAVYQGLGAAKAFDVLVTGVVGQNPTLIVAMMVGIYLLLGMVMDDFAMLIVTAHMFIPVLVGLEVNMVWFGVLYCVTVLVALLTPPFGFALFIMKGLVPKDSGITMVDIYKSIIPFVALNGILLAVLIFNPQIALWLPAKVFGG
ncbi:MAG: TRAP transporter large permease subunit [Chloroflexi bacterium]|nr:TRAP transporter large permease subunit [Chloroflexota bacterium]